MAKFITYMIESDLIYCSSLKFIEFWAKLTTKQINDKFIPLQNVHF